MYAIGLPGHPARMFAFGANYQDQILSGEVAVPVTDSSQFYKIDARGRRALPTPPPTEYTLRQFRVARASFFAANEWKMLPHSPMTEVEKADLSARFQELRDMPEKGVKAMAAFLVGQGNANK